VPLLVHGIIEASASDAPASSPLSEDDELTSVRHGRLEAIVRSTETLEVLPSRANLLAHTRVLEALTAETTALPMRFGMVVANESDLVDGYLAPQHDALLAAIDRLRGHVELRLRGRYDEDAVVRDVVASDPAIARLRGRGGMEAQMQLGERIVAGIDARREQDLHRVTEQLGPHVAGVVAGGVAEPLDAFSLSLLVAEDGMADFDRALDELGQELAPALALELVGPVPPLSFAVSEGASA
jgi:hypothetical protein